MEVSQYVDLNVKVRNSAIVLYNPQLPMNGTNESRQNTNEFYCDIPEKIIKGFLKRKKKILFKKKNQNIKCTSHLLF